MQQIIFSNFQEAKDAYYETHDIMSDDVDDEEAKIMRWLEENGHEVDE